jgi:hypothetical protein
LHPSLLRPEIRRPVVQIHQVESFCFIFKFPAKFEFAIRNHLNIIRFDLQQADSVAKVQSAGQGSLGNQRAESQLGERIGDGRAAFGRRLADDCEERRQIRRKCPFDF